jgi:hypothetical protein
MRLYSPGTVRQPVDRDQRGGSNREEGLRLQRPRRGLDGWPSSRGGGSASPGGSKGRIPSECTRSCSCACMLLRHSCRLRTSPGFSKDEVVRQWREHPLGPRHDGRILGHGRRPGALTLSEDDRRVSTMWAADGAERTLSLFEAQAPRDTRLYGTSSITPPCKGASRALSDREERRSRLPLSANERRVVFPPSRIIVSEASATRRCGAGTAMCAAHIGAPSSPWNETCVDGSPGEGCYDLAAYVTTRSPASSDGVSSARHACTTDP